MSEWIGWNGGECPVHPNDWVHTASEKGLRAGYSKDFDWSNTTTNPFSVIAYRVIKEYKEPREFWIVECCVYSSQEAARLHCHNRCCHISEIIHVREVLDENS